jgi:signal transduction histidine kinase
MKRLPSLVRRQIGWQLAAMAIAWFGLTAWLMVQMMAFGNGDLDRRMEFFAQALAEAGSAARNDAQDLERRLATTEHIFIDGVITELDTTRNYVPVYQLWTSDGALIRSSQAAPSVPLGDHARGLATRVIDDHDYRVAAAVSSDGKVRAVLGERIDQRFAANLPVLQVIGGAQLLIYGWIVVVTWIAARRGFRPLTVLADHLVRRTPGDLAPIAAGRPYKETAPVVDAMNDLLAREEQRLEFERGFLADAAHELRTPLAAINAQAHVVLTASDPVSLGTARLELERGIDRVSHLLSQLLTMARLEATPSAAPMEVIDVAELCRQRLAALSMPARQRAIKLAFDGPEYLTAKVHRAGLLSVIDNLVDNAIRYTPEGGNVDVKLSSSADSIELLVRDDGPGIAHADRERVFERFVRLAKGVEEGSGLGLSIVKRVLASQSATLRFVDGIADKGVGLLVTLPTSARQTPLTCLALARR